MNPSAPADPDFDIRLDRYGKVVLLSLSGRLDAAAAAILQQYLVNVLVSRIPPLLVVDLTCVLAVDAEARDILLSADRHARAFEGRLIVVGAGVLPGRLGGLEMFPGVAEALAALTE
ncbi:hypothetical protein HII36_34745 [Nonomuraea sp. NN258]|uniref:STAS domain-containing protein n=1 Tax=Nonomuraea antri TaxID=2730852 RepID=UPI001569F4BA|nr:STAS domain-containing protein [Nonomuraea antri]NRQ36959.1 hypothetical protein [Nonomuraea antri]